MPDVTLLQDRYRELIGVVVDGWRLHADAV